MKRRRQRNELSAAAVRAWRALRKRRGRRALACVAAAALALAAVFVLWPSAARRAVRLALEPASLARVERYAPLVRAAAAEQGVDPCLIAAIIYAESRGRAEAVSSAGALGLMQLMPTAAADAARALGLEPPSTEQLLADPALNIRLGTRHFAWTLANEKDDRERALCAYNAGRGRLAEWIRAAGSYRKWRANQMRAGDSKVLAYAQQVLEYATVFRKRGLIDGASRQIAAE